MRRLLLAAITFLSGSLAFSQSEVNALEYYIDEDPGVGNATSVTITPGTELDINFTVPISGLGLSPGFHLMGVRTQDATGNWSFHEKRTFYIQENAGAPPSTPLDVSALEYFLDEDPGVGSATLVAVTPGQEIDINDLIDVSSLSDGFHIIGTRARDAGGTWGFTESRIFYVQNVVSTNPTPVDVTELEYFYDEDPGVGSATSIGVTTGQMIDINQLLPASTLSPGFHTVHVRAKNADGNWGLSESRILYIQVIETGSVGLVPISALEYFIDVDPGLGQATQVPVSPSQPVVDIMNIALSTGGPLTIGSHLLTIRAQDENGNWGHSETISFDVDGDCPIASFSVQNACVGEDIQLVDESTGIIGMGDYAWYADGELISNTAGDITHSFNNPGMHTLSLAIRNGSICTDSTGVEIEVKAKPFVTFSAESGTLGLPTNFQVDDFQVDGSYTWEWDFDSDGNIDDNTVGDVDFTFGSSGTFQTTLTITDGSGCGASYMRDVIVLADAVPTVLFEASIECEGTATVFTDLSTSVPAGSTYSWDFDDDGVTDDSSVGSVQFSYGASGTYTASLTIETPTSDVYTTTEVILVEALPQAEFTNMHTISGSSANVQFENLSANGDSFLWDFGDGNSSSDENPMHEFQNFAGQSFEICLTTTNGCSQDQICQSIVFPDNSPVANFESSIECEGGSTAFTDLSENVPAGSTYSWDFDDDGVIDDTSVGSVEHIYATPGDYTARLTIETPTSELFAVTNTVSVVAEPTVDFTVGPTCEGQPVSFTDESSDVGSGSYYWDFDGDGTVDSETAGDVEFTYSSPGTYVASLLIDNGGECFGFKAVNVQVTLSPVAAFSFSHATSGSSAIAQFENQSTDGVDYLWDFGDGNSSTESSPEHEFANFLGETFEICLTTTNGCSQDQVCQSISFEVTGIQTLTEAGIKAYPNPSYGDLFLSFADVQRDEYKIQVHDLSGRLVLEEFVNTSMNTTFRSRISVKGSYLLSVTSPKLKAQQKIVIR